MDNISEMQNIMFAQIYYMEPYNFHMVVICDETATQKV